MADVVFSDLAELTSWGDDDLFMVTDDSESVSEKSKKIKARTIEKRMRPPGEIAPFMLSSAPTGWLACDGSAVSRTTYADLFSAVGEIFGDGDESTTFNLPDLQGYFLRGWDNGAGNDPDAADRTDRGDGTDGDVIGSIQQDELKEHRHSPGGGSGDRGYKYLAGQGYAGYGGYAGGNETRPKNINVLYCIKY